MNVNNVIKDVFGVSKVNYDKDEKLTRQEMKDCKYLIILRPLENREENYISYRSSIVVCLEDYKKNKKDYIEFLQSNFKSEDPYCIHKASCDVVVFMPKYLDVLIKGTVNSIGEVESLFELTAKYSNANTITHRFLNSRSLCMTAPQVINYVFNALVKSQYYGYKFIEAIERSNNKEFLEFMYKADNDYRGIWNYLYGFLNIDNVFPNKDTLRTKAFLEDEYVTINGTSINLIEVINHRNSIRARLLTADKKEK